MRTKKLSEISPAAGFTAEGTESAEFLRMFGQLQSFPSGRRPHVISLTRELGRVRDELA